MLSIARLTTDVPAGSEAAAGIGKARLQQIDDAGGIMDQYVREVDVANPFSSSIRSGTRVIVDGEANRGELLMIIAADCT